MFGRNLLLSFSRIFQKINKININEFRFIHKIVHNPNRGIFYVKLGNNGEKILFKKNYDFWWNLICFFYCFLGAKDERAVLTYKKDGKILDLRTISVPKEHQAEGLARRLTEVFFLMTVWKI